MSTDMQSPKNERTLIVEDIENGVRVTVARREKQIEHF
jgi:hypothetical protein